MFKNVVFSKINQKYQPWTHKDHAKPLPILIHLLNLTKNIFHVILYLLMYIEENNAEKQCHMYVKIIERNT